MSTATATRTGAVKAAQARAFAALVATADAAGTAAGTAATPTPMVVGTAKSLFDNSFDESKPTYFVSEGVCGFASVRFPGNTAFGRWAKASGIARPAYGGGLSVYVRFGGQSLARKEAFARAYAAVLREAGVDAYVESRMD